MSVDYPEPVELNTQIRTLRKPSDIAGGEIKTSAVYLSVTVMVQTWLLFLVVGMGDSENLLRMYNSVYLAGKSIV